MVVYQTARLRLRQFTPADVSLLFDLDSDPDVRRYVHLPPPESLDPYRERIARCERDYAETPGVGYWAAEADGAFVGWFHLRPALDARFPAECGYRAGDLEVGYRLRREVWGRGYATEGTRRLIAVGLGELAAERVVASALEANVASWRVMEKAGMTRVADGVRLSGIDGSAVVYAVVRPAE